MLNECGNTFQFNSNSVFELQVSFCFILVQLVLMYLMSLMGSYISLAAVAVIIIVKSLICIFFSLIKYNRQSDNII